MKLMNSESQLSTVQSNYLKIQTEYENSQKHLSEYELHIKNLHAQFEKFKKMIEDLQR